VTLPEEQGAVEQVIAGKSDLAYTVAIEILPTIELADFKGIQLERMNAEVTETEVDEALAKIAEQSRPFAPKGEGAKAENGDRVTIDADGTYDAADLTRIVRPILEDQADFVSGSRRLGTELTTDRVRHLGVLVFGAIISVLIRQRITDPACGLRAMRAELTAAVTLEQPQYQASELMISAALQGFRLAEVPSTMRDRARHATTTKKGGNLGYGIRFARAAVHTWRRDRTAARTRLRPEKTHTS